MADDQNILVEINDLLVNFYTYQGTVQAIEGIDLNILKGETLGLVGETGCGKSVSASTIMKLILSPPGKIEGGSIYFMEPPEVRQRRKEYEAEAQKWYERQPLAEKKKLVGTYAPRYTGFKKRVKPLTAKDLDTLEIPSKAPSRLVTNYLRTKGKKLPKDDKVGRDALAKTFDLLPKSNEYMQKIRGKFISMIFQEPTAALNPVFTAGDQIAEVILVHRKAEMAGRVLVRINEELKMMKKSARAQDWYSKLPESERRRIVATNFGKVQKNKDQIEKTKIPTTVPKEIMAEYLKRTAGDDVKKAQEWYSKLSEYEKKKVVATRLHRISKTKAEIEKTKPLPKLPPNILRLYLKRKSRPTKVLWLPERPKEKKPPQMPKGTYHCTICDAEVTEQDSWCDTCGHEFYSLISWTIRLPVIETYKKLLESIKKNPASKNAFISRVPLLKRYKLELYKEAIREATRMLDIVRIPDPKGVASRYPYELSGGMQQRVMIAMALACNPKLLIADEPTTALDVTIQGQILKLMRDLKQQYGSSILLITHNLGVVAEMCDRVGVMYAGSMAEVGTARAIFKEPLHPYTAGLMKSVPSVQMEAAKLYTIRGSVPNLIYPPPGCRFHPRCDFAKGHCKKVRPIMAEVEPGHFVSCHMVTKAEGYLAE